MRAYFSADVVETSKDISYVQGTSNPRQRLDVYVPRGGSGFPVVVFIHGGYWIAQDKDYFAPLVGLYGNVGRALARRGIGVVVLNYRLVPDVAFPEQLSDVVSAIRWTQDNVERYGGDPRRLVVAGHSAGGHMAALLALDPARLRTGGVDAGSIKGFAPLSPIFDLEDMAARPPDADFNDRVTTPVFGQDLRTHSPKTYYGVTAVPLFVAMGERDEPYLVTQVPKAVQDLRALGAEITFQTLAEHDHADVVLNFDTADDRLSAPLAAFDERVTR
jgi:acetyl esterase/lipase